MPTERGGATARPECAYQFDAMKDGVMKRFFCMLEPGHSDDHMMTIGLTMPAAVSSHDALVEKLRALAALLPRIDNYFGNGGLFNPEHMEHDKVRDLLRDIRDAIRALRDGR